MVLCFCKEYLHAHSLIKILIGFDVKPLNVENLCSKKTIESNLKVIIYLLDKIILFTIFLSTPLPAPEEKTQSFWFSFPQTSG